MSSAGADGRGNATCRRCSWSRSLWKPGAREAGLGLAQSMADAGQPRRAFDKLCELLDRRGGWRFFRTDELPPQQLTEELAELFNTLHAQLGVRDRPLLHVSAAQDTA